MTDIKTLYHQEENEKYINTKFGKEQWVLLSGKTQMNGADASFSSGLISLDHLKDLYRNDSWDIQSEYCTPGFQTDEGDNSEYHRNCEDNEGKEVLVYQREFYGIKPNLTELSEEFRLINNLYFEESEKSYYSIKKDGQCDLAVRINGDAISVRLDYLMRYISAKQMALVLYFDISFAVSGGLKDNNLERFNKTVKNDEFYYSVCGNEMNFPEKRTISRLLGKRIILPRNKNTCGFWPFEKKRNYMDYVIGMDERGIEISHSSDPDKLSNCFVSIKDEPQYLTPVFFKKDVLQKYMHDSKYEITDSYLKCGYLWGLSIDLDHRNYVMAYLGDLGSYLPECEQNHWKSYNVLTDEKISKSSFMKDFLNVPAKPEIADIKFKNTFSSLNSDWEAKFGWPLFLPLNGADEYIKNNLRIPLSNGQEEFDQQVLSLNKLIIDSLNEKQIGREITLQQNMHGITKLEEWLKAKGAEGFEPHICFLRDLQELRSSGTGHRKGKNYQQIINKMNLIGSDKKADFEKLLLHSIEFLEYMEKILETIFSEDTHSLKTGG